MRIWDSISLSLHSAARSPLRVLLAAGSMAIGITALLVIVSGERSWRGALDQWYQLRGVDVINVVRTSFSGRIAPNLPGNAEETQRFLRNCPSISSATPVARGWFPLRSGRQVTPPCAARGVLPGFERVFGTRLLRGRFFVQEDEMNRAPVCIIDAGLARLLLSTRDLVGKEIRVGGYRMRVIGIADDLSQGGLVTAEGLVSGEIFRYPAHQVAFEHRVAGLVVPLSTARHSLHLTVDKLAARADDHTAAIPQIGRYFGANPWAKQEDAWVFSAAEKKQAAILGRQRMQFFVGLAVLLVLMSSGIGLASVMFVAVSDRQREIGIHRAYGATRGAITRTFLLESVWLGLLGALGGLLLGFPAVRYLGTITFPYEFDWDPMAALNVATSVLPGMKVSLEWPVLACAVVAALATAVLAGYEPASAAAHLSPSEAIASPEAARHRLRHILTAIQVSIGIVSVLLMTAIHEGIALEQLGWLGKFSLADTVITDLTPTYSMQEMEPIAAPMKTLASDLEAVKEISRACPAFNSIESQVSSQQPLKWGRYAHTVGVMGVSSGYLTAEKMRLMEGRFFTEEEVRSARRAVVLSDRATGFLGMDRAVGETIRIGGLPFQVVGVVATGPEILGSDDGATEALVPLPCIPAAWTAGFPYIGRARLRAHLRSESNWSMARHQLLAALAKRLPKQTMQHLDLHGNIPDRERLSGLRRAAAIRASVIGFSALLVAIIGLVNMLLVSVSEQTREIGIRRALGATRSSIAAMVVLEALVICLPGCIVGVGLGIVAAHYVGGWAHLSTIVPAFWIVVSACTALLGGLVASLLPAIRAALLHPVAALRTE